MDFRLLSHTAFRHTRFENRTRQRWQDPPTNGCWTSFSVRRSAISEELLTRLAGWRATRQGPADPMDDAVAIGGSGFGVVAILVAYRSEAAPVPAVAANPNGQRRGTAPNWSRAAAASSSAKPSVEVRTAVSFAVDDT